MTANDCMVLLYCEVLNLKLGIVIVYYKQGGLLCSPLDVPYQLQCATMHKCIKNSAHYAIT